MAAAAVLWLVAQFPAPLVVALRAHDQGRALARIRLRAGPFLARPPVLCLARQYGQIGGSLTKWPPR
ncbi:hypothetical protein [Streptomyces sp. NPDC046909]|uniref:hypothetical protein n=1 Tax=Streptomyces sp. NPDC046909 TaxID=3155617 RepID=UPI0033CDFA8B